jgi:hypothetical protein
VLVDVDRLQPCPDPRWSPAAQQRAALPGRSTEGGGDCGCHARCRRRSTRPSAARIDRGPVALRATHPRSVRARRGGPGLRPRRTAGPSRKRRTPPRGRNGHVGLGRTAALAQDAGPTARRAALLRGQRSHVRPTVVERRRASRSAPDSPSSDTRTRSPCGIDTHGLGIARAHTRRSRVRIPPPLLRKAPEIERSTRRAASRRQPVSEGRSSAFRLCALTPSSGLACHKPLGSRRVGPHGSHPGCVCAQS